MDLEFRAERSAMRCTVDIYVLDRATGKWVTDLVVGTIEEGTYMRPPIEIDVTAAQGLMDELWRCGLRPTEGTGSAGSLAATERHLADMQRIAFRCLHRLVEPAP